MKSQALKGTTTGGAATMSQSLARTCSTSSTARNTAGPRFPTTSRAPALRLPGRDVPAMGKPRPGHRRHRGSRACVVLIVEEPRPEEDRRGGQGGQLEVDEGGGSRDAGFYWQNGYAAFSVSQSNVEEVHQYIERQEEHHRKMTFQDELRACLGGTKSRMMNATCGTDCRASRAPIGRGCVTPARQGRRCMAPKGRNISAQGKRSGAAADAALGRRSCGISSLKGRNNRCVVAPLQGFGRSRFWLPRAARVASRPLRWPWADMLRSLSGDGERVSRGTIAESGT